MIMKEHKYYIIYICVTKATLCNRLYSERNIAKESLREVSYYFIIGLYNWSQIESQLSQFKNK